MAQQRSQPAFSVQHPASPPPVSRPPDSPPRSALWIRALSRWPWPLLYVISDVVAWLLRYLIRYRVAVAKDNLQRCFPNATTAELNSILSRFYRQLTQVAVESLKLPTMSAAELRRRVRIVNLPLAQSETAAGRSMVLLAAHQCNWEWALQGVTLGIGVPLDAAYKPLRSTRADREVLTVRSRFGARMVAAKKLVREVARRRDEVHAICLMADQMPRSSVGRHWLTFLGRDTAFYPGPGEIAHMTGYAAFFVAMRRTARGCYDLEFLPITQAGERLQPELFTARYAQLIEAQIMAQPADWMWTHRRWKDVRPAAAPAASSAP